MRSARSPKTALVFGLVLGIATAACSGSGPDRRPVTPTGQDISLPAEVHTLAARVARGATLSSLLHAHQVADQEIIALIDRASAVFDVRGLRTDRPYRIVQGASGDVRRFEYEIDNDRVLTVRRTAADEFVAAIDPIEKRTAVTVVNGAIERDAPSLFAAMSRTGEQVELSMALADVLSSEVDFNTELQPGDRFGILVEKQFRDHDALMPAEAGPTSGVAGDTPVIFPGGSEEMTPDADAGRPLATTGEAFAGYGAIQAAEFFNAGRAIRAVRFTPAGGKPEYFDEQGRSLRRFFLKSPLKFDPIITSRFTSHRKHPVLGFTRAHLGVDFRAPTGAPVVAVADGLVVSATFAGGSGRMVHMRHANGLETQYLHLSAFKVRGGERVRQGEVIGLVGESGLATGPHLDYRVRKDGTYVNPVAFHQAMPPGDPVAPGDMPAFIDTRDRALQALGVRRATGSDTN